MEVLNQTDFEVQKKCAEKFFEISHEERLRGQPFYYEEIEWDSEPERYGKIHLEPSNEMTIFPTSNTNLDLKKFEQSLLVQENVSEASDSDQELLRMKSEMVDSGLYPAGIKGENDYDVEGISRIKELRTIRGPKNYLDDLQKRKKPTLTIITEEVSNTGARSSLKHALEFAKPIALRRKPMPNLGEYSYEDIAKENQEFQENPGLYFTAEPLVQDQNEVPQSPDYDKFSPETYLKLSGPLHNLNELQEANAVLGIVEKTPKKIPILEQFVLPSTPKRAFEKSRSPFENTSEEDLNYDSRFSRERIDPMLPYLDSLIEEYGVAMPEENKEFNNTEKNQVEIGVEEVNAFISEYFENGERPKIVCKDSSFQQDFSNTKSTIATSSSDPNLKSETLQTTALSECIPKLLEYQNFGVNEGEASPLKPINPLQYESEEEESLVSQEEASSTLKAIQNEIEERFCYRGQPIPRNYIVADVARWTQTKFPWDEEVDTIRKEVFGLGCFRPNQKGIINAVLCKRDVFVCMPTGGGKSLIFQIAALLGDGITFVIQPLLSLIQDQMCHLSFVGVKAVCLTSSIPKDRQREILFDLEFGPNPPKLVYVTPEKVCKSSVFVATLNRLYAQRRIDRFVIDEVHCVSQWGRDFRPDYLELKCLKDHFSNVQIIGLTATATEKVKHDIISQLELKTCLYFQSSFNRPNLIYEVWDKPSKFEKTIEIVASFIKNKYPGKCGIIYCCSKKDCVEVAKSLSENFNIRAKPYHSGMPEPIRTKTQEEWMQDDIQVVVATIAFGMGIDKADVRYVIHFTFAKSIENYYQESGRAGRDGLTSHCIVLYSFSDRISIYSLIKKTESKTISVGHVIKMIKYCEEKKICRRSIQLAYLGERFDPTDCRMTCDNCEKKIELKSYEALNEAKMALEFIEKLTEVNYKITMLQLVECFRGKFEFKFNPKKIELAKLQNFGFLKNFSRENIERLLKTMLLEEVITERLQENYANHVSAYVLPNARRDLRIESLKVVFKSSRYNKISETITPTAPLEPEVIAKRWHKEFGFCHPDQFDVLLAVLKRTRLGLYNQEKAQGMTLNSIENFIPSTALISLAKWLPIGFQDPHVEKIHGMGPQFLRKYGELFFDQILVFASKEGIRKSEFRGVPDKEEVLDQVFDYQKHQINTAKGDIGYDDIQDWSGSDIDEMENREFDEISFPVKRVKVN